MAWGWGRVKYTVRPISDRTAFTGRHRLSPFQAPWSSTLDLLDREVRQVKGRNVVIEVDVPESEIRVDGTLYARARAASPAVRLALDSAEGPMIYATDRFTWWQDNVRAIALGMEALRKVQRYGIAERGEQYAGFKALPAGRGMPASHMTSDEAWALIGGYGSVPVRQQRADYNAGNKENVRSAYRRARAEAHPDRNGGFRGLWDMVEEAGRVLGVAS